VRKNLEVCSTLLNFAVSIIVIDFKPFKTPFDTMNFIKKNLAKLLLTSAFLLGSLQISDAGCDTCQDYNNMACQCVGDTEVCADSGSACCVMAGPKTMLTTNP
jgi:hypothetical protein